MKIAEAIKNKFKKAVDEIDTIAKEVEDDILKEQEAIADLQEQISARWNAVMEDGGATEDEVAYLDILTIELERRTKRVQELLRQLESAKTLKAKAEKGAGSISPDTIFKGLVSIITVLLVIHAEETRPVISKAMGFVIKPHV